MKIKDADHHVIQAKRQDNGLWGTPMQCYAVDKINYTNDENWLLQSALIIAFSELHPNNRFKIMFSGKESITFCFDKPIKDNNQYYTACFKDFRLEDNRLYWIGDKINRRKYNIRKVLEDNNG